MCSRGSGQIESHSEDVNTLEAINHGGGDIVNSECVVEEVDRLRHTVRM
jgi:hypothetical protein